ncbi:MAG: PH domain-containing protein [Candidatus Binatia bacterium]|nr:PH domain-containing protein [Candidatus Binatia bacterium]
MDYTESNLMAGEKIVARARLHWIIFIWPTVLAFIPVMMLTGSGAQGAPGLFIIAAIWGAAALANLQTSEFAVTNKRVLMKLGWIRRHSLELLLPKVESIQVHQGILGTSLDYYGTIIVSGTGGAKEPFHRIAAPLDFRKRVQEQIEVGTYPIERPKGSVSVAIARKAFCSECGERLEDNDKFCASCGAQRQAV